MKTLLTALQEGRFVELPETNKDKVLNYLANLIEAMPDLSPGTDVAGAVLAREAQFNTGIGQGWACPHARTNHDGPMICAAGWSPSGLDYGSMDGKPVYFVVMYYVPDPQKHVYLKEISSLAKAIHRKQADQDISKMPNLAAARDWILDLVSTALESQMSDAKARMIHLEARQAAATSVTDASQSIATALPYTVVPASIVISPGLRPIILSQDLEIIAKLETGNELEASLSKQASFDYAGCKVVFRSVTSYQSKRSVYDCLVLKTLAPANPDKPKA